jgi:hypothetical protein
MADDVVTDLEIAVLCNLLDGPGVNLKAHRRSVLDALLSKGLVGRAKDKPERFQLTDKASANRVVKAYPDFVIFVRTLAKVGNAPVPSRDQVLISLRNTRTRD